jgi:hypothetical protein
VLDRLSSLLSGQRDVESLLKHILADEFSARRSEELGGESPGQYGSETGAENAAVGSGAGPQGPQAGDGNEMAGGLGNALDDAAQTEASQDMHTAFLRGGRIRRCSHFFATSADELRWTPEVPFRYHVLGYRDFVMGKQFDFQDSADAASCFLGLVLEKLEKPFRTLCLECPTSFRRWNM